MTRMTLDGTSSLPLFRIIDITDSVTASVGDNAEFSCMVDANPMTADTIKWTRDGFDMESRDERELPLSVLTTITTKCSFQKM